MSLAEKAISRLIQKLIDIWRAFRRQGITAEDVFREITGGELKGRNADNASYDNNKKTSSAESRTTDRQLGIGAIADDRVRELSATAEKQSPEPTSEAVADPINSIAQNSQQINKQDSETEGGVSVTNPSLKSTHNRIYPHDPCRYTL